MLFPAPVWVIEYDNYQEVNKGIVAESSSGRESIRRVTGLPQHECRTASKELTLRHATPGLTLQGALNLVGELVEQAV